MEHVRQLECGYYGYQVNSLIHKCITRHPQTSILTKDFVFPFKPQEYISDILVPEIGWRLIQQDQKCDDCTAIDMMTESREFGRILRGESDTEDS